MTLTDGQDNGLLHAFCARRRGNSRTNGSSRRSTTPPRLGTVVIVKRLSIGECQVGTQE